MSDLKNEFKEHIEVLKNVVGDSAFVLFSIEDSFDRIIEMFLEEEIREVEGFGELTLDEQKQEIKEDLDDLRSDLKNNTIIMKKLCEFLKVSIDRKVEIKKKESLKKLLELQDSISTDLLPQIQVELESLSDEFKYKKDEKFQEMSSGVAKLVEELIDKNINLVSLLETIFGFELEQNYDLDLERV